MICRLLSPYPLITSLPKKKLRADLKHKLVNPNGRMGPVLYITDIKLLPIWEPIHVPTSPLPTQPPANGPSRISEG